MIRLLHSFRTAMSALPDCDPVPTGEVQRLDEYHRRCYRLYELGAEAQSKYENAAVDEFVRGLVSLQHRLPLPT